MDHRKPFRLSYDWRGDAACLVLSSLDGIVPGTSHRIVCCLPGDHGGRLGLSSMMNLHRGRSGEILTLERDGGGLRQGSPHCWCQTNHALPKIEEVDAAYLIHPNPSWAACRGNRIFFANPGGPPLGCNGVEASRQLSLLPVARSEDASWSPEACPLLGPLASWPSAFGPSSTRHPSRHPPSRPGPAPTPSSLRPESGSPPKALGRT